MVRQREGAKGNTCWRTADTFFFSFFFNSVFSRSSAAVRVDLTTYGMVGPDWSHDRAVAEGGGKAGAGGMSGGVMNTCTGPKWQFEELRPYRLQYV